MGRYRALLNRIGVMCLLSALCVSISTPMIVTAQTDSCADSLPPRLTIGGIGRVTPGISNNMRDAANKTGKLVGKIPGGESFNVLDGPKCVDGVNWWQVNYADVQGWTAEADNKDYWLVPYDPTYKETTADGLTHIQYDNLSFDIDSTLAEDVVDDFVTAEWQSQGALADHVCFYLHRDPPDQRRQSNQLCVISTNGMDYQVKILKQIITDHPTFGAPDGVTWVPSPLAGAAQLLQAKINYINTPTLQGLSFITYYAQDDYYITGDMLQYNFSGLTRDGKFIIFLSYVANTALLPTDTYTDDQDRMDALSAVWANPPAYYKTIVATLNAGKATDFTPNLDKLDAIINSITFS